jgi:hypothetical protein
MIIKTISPVTIDWNTTSGEKINGEKGFYICRKYMDGDTRLRLVEFSENYIADHWCLKGHYIYVVEGNISIDHSDNSSVKLEKNMTYIVGDDIMPHMVTSEKGATVLILD